MTDLLTRQGPLAQVWLASNYDKKLSKQQLLKTNLVSSSEYISNQPIQSSSKDNAQPITLRLSGHLLLGIVKIYSRKTKYLLDDVNEVLYKLKNSFKFASGATLGTSAAFVNLPPQQTTLSNINRIMLQDQVTDLNLLYQDDLDLDDHPTERLLDQMSSGDGATDNVDLDRSIEVGRGVEENEDFDFDFDLSMDVDTSIEQGRDAQVALPDAEQSLLDIGSKTAEGQEQPLGFDLGEPLETISELQTEQQSAEQTENRQRRRLVGVGEDGLVRTTKRKLVVDSAEDLERGLPVEVLRSIQRLQTFGRFTDEHLTINLTQSQKLQLIKELAEPSVAKRRKIWNLDDELTQHANQLSAEEQRQRDAQYEDDYDLDFDLSLPSLESDNEGSNDQADALEDGSLSNVKTTTQVAQHLRNTFLDQPTASLDDLMKKDLEFKDAEDLPLGMVSKTDTTIEISKRREATKCFFETLVLATQNCITLEQKKTEPTDIGEKITIRPLDNLAAKFL
ncbi:hypothetical protein FT663_02384 [Candidozyma haemuli var. vulneris]|uniref:Rad21/Rec8-like protein N-terminal domain-containing protein n=1 Tax=Candidozyma haemuli TaxID=45357 RepID=A0A2V1AZ54_9ASCO|nr:hypothetical protein CXQ85_002897 [[Candida] haemuloni]KAF3988350.1 hypothetical protein FT662_03465 [[Candida] haemuloni var. vulneris]KAF3992194.1 hypothetical protein FT663_02384 [[Candida] haemuloni var. vulneris]PVH23168.1 hypothetical protein CXQ85_002897 [[Candida] haemuloni]